MSSLFSLWGQYVGPFAQGLLVTLKITGLGLAVGIGLGAILAAFRLSKFRLLRLVGALYVDIMRAIPVLVLLFMAYYGLGQVGIRLPGVLAATAALGGFYASLYCEIFRGGVTGVPRGQWEAAQALGMGPWLRLRKVVLPQAFLAILLPSTNQASNILKDSSLVVTIGAADLTSQAYQASADTFKPMDMFILAGLFYFGLYLIISRALGRWELHVQRTRG